MLCLIGSLAQKKQKGSMECTDTLQQLQDLNRMLPLMDSVLPIDDNHDPWLMYSCRLDVSCAHGPCFSCAGTIYAD